MKIKTTVLILLCTLCFTSCAKKNDSLLTIRLCESRQIDLIEKDGYIYSYCYDSDHNLKVMDRWDIESQFWEWVDPDDPDTRSGDCMTSLCFRIPENANSADPNYMNLSISRSDSGFGQEIVTNQGTIVVNKIEYFVLTWESDAIPESSVLVF